MNEDLQLGTIIKVTKTYGLETVSQALVISKDPHTSSWKDAGVWVRLLCKKSGKILSGSQVQFGPWRLDCMSREHLIENDRFGKLEFDVIDQLTDDQIDQMFDAEGYAEKQRHFEL